MNDVEQGVEPSVELGLLNAYNHTLEILCFLYNVGERVNQTTLRKGIGVMNSQTVQNSLNPLEDLGLIEMNMVMPRTLWISLTPKGERVASLVSEINRALAGDP